MTKAQMRLWAKSHNYPFLALVPPVWHGLEEWRKELQCADASRLATITRRIELWQERVEGKAS